MNQNTFITVPKGNPLNFVQYFTPNLSQDPSPHKIANKKTNSLASIYSESDTSATCTCTPAFPFAADGLTNT